MAIISMPSIYLMIQKCNRIYDSITYVYITYVYIISHNLIYSYNPFIYCWRDETFRGGAQKLLLLNAIRIKRNNNNFIGQQKGIKSEHKESLRQMTRIEIPDRDLRFESKSTLTSSDV